VQDLNDKVTGDALPATEWNQPMSEIQNIIEALGQSLTNADLNQLGKALAGYVGSASGYTDGGAPNAIVLSPITPLQAPPQYTNRMRVNFTKNGTNTLPVTINVAGIGLLNFLDQTGSVLASGDLIDGVDYEARFSTTIDGGNPGFKFEKPSAVSNILPRAYIDGFITSNNSIDAVNDIDIAAGAAKNSTNVADMNLSSALGKQIDVPWVEGGTPGATAGGFPSLLTAGSPVNDTWYRIFIIRRASGQIDAGFDISASAVNLLADATDYTEFRQVGWIRYGTAIILPYTQVSDRFELDVEINDLAAGSAITSAQQFTATVPPDGKIHWIGFVNGFDSSPNDLIPTVTRFFDPDKTDVAVSRVNATLLIGSNDAAAGESTDSTYVELFTDSAQQISWRSDVADASVSFVANTVGWSDRRGKQ